MLRHLEVKYFASLADAAAFRGAARAGCQIKSMAKSCLAFTWHSYSRAQPEHDSSHPIALDLLDYLNTNNTNKSVVHLTIYRELA